MSPFDFFLVFFKASLITFAGLGSLPVLQQELVHYRGWATDEDIAKSVAVGRISPGPNGMYVVSLGYLLMGWLGASLALLAAVLPPLVVLPLAAVVRRTMHLPWVDGLMRGLALGSAGLLLSVGAGLVTFGGFELSGPKLANLGLAGLGLALTWSGRIHPVVVLGVAGALGVLLSAVGW